MAISKTRGAAVRVEISHCGMCTGCILAPPHGALQLKQIELPKNRSVYLQGVPADGVFVVRSGSIRLTSVDFFGNARIVQFVRAGDLFGLDSFLPDKTRIFTAITREHCNLCCTTSEEFRALIQADSERAWKLFLAINQMLNENRREKLEISGQRVQKRIKALLAYLWPADRMPSPTNSPGADLKQWELAQFLGVSQETISRELKHIRYQSASKRAIA